mgnify:CR=1 FL=1|jgi:hypothetical protein
MHVSDDADILLPIASLQVSRCQAKMKRPLTDDDYKAKHKFTFDM